MKEELISYETAELAKEKGFHEETQAMTCGKEYPIVCNPQEETTYDWNSKEGYSIPTQSLLQKWLREKHNIHIYIETTPTFDKMQGNKWKCSIKYCFQPFKWTTGHYYLKNTYEESLELGLQNALKLI
jgi:hypothetical protein